jgi:UDP-GlcNAc3NAcA epimerase
MHTETDKNQKKLKTILSIIGARPQFIKHAPMQLVLQQYFKAVTIHTGQHYDSNMSHVFFDELGMAKPDYVFDLGGTKHQGAQTGLMMAEIEKVAMNIQPDAILIYGDTNSTLAAALVAAKMGIPQIHIEAGLRSYNRSMPEEINRIVADEFASLLFCPTQQAIDNLAKEGINHAGIFRSGDVMCDTLKLIEKKITPLVDFSYYFVTLHRPYNVDDELRLRRILATVNQLSKKVIFPIHPRTVSMMRGFGLNTSDYLNIQFIDPVGYIESVSYQKYADCVITDSGGMQKEAYMLRKKCITLRSETEWVETLTNGWNTLIFDDVESLQQEVTKQPGTYIPDIYGIGHAATEIVEIINERING